MPIPHPRFAGLRIGAAFSILLLTPALTKASSHMDAPLITRDPSAHITDVYAFVSQIGNVKYLTAAVAVYPFEEPSIGPNKYNFDDNVLYAMHIATGPDLAAGRPTVSYLFKFDTTFKNNNTIAQSFLGPIKTVDDANQNLTQRYSVTKVIHRSNQNGRWNEKDCDRPEVLGANLTVPPNNQGLVTPYYNQNGDGNMLAKEGVNDASKLDVYTSGTIHPLNHGYLVFAGQRSDGFYANIQSIFDLDVTFSGPEKPLDSQAGFNVHTIVLNIPLAELGGDQQIVGVYATTSRKAVTVLRDPRAPASFGEYVQVHRKGNPAFNELLVAGIDKDLYTETSPTVDQIVFAKYALNPELAKLLRDAPNLQTARTDLAGIFIPDLVKVDLSTGPAHLAGNPDNPDNPSFNRLSIFGGDVLTSTVQQGFGNGTVPGGWPNGRRFGDDVLGIAVIAILSDLRVSPPQIFAGFDPTTFNVGGVVKNDISYNGVFPYAPTPHNGRDNEHHTQP
jgi:Domain of unknown function (DUF4331)